MLGQKRPELDNLTVCDKFEPTILEGQLCYSINIANLEKRQTEAGKKQGLFLLLDSTPYQIQDDKRGVDRRKFKNFLSRGRHRWVGVDWDGQRYVVCIL